MKRFFIEHPLLLAAISVVALNDHVFKHSAMAGVLTGKLSDFAGLFFFPFLIVDLASLLRRPWQRSPQFFMITLLSILVVFAALKCSMAAGQLLSSTYAAFSIRAQVVRDVTDLYALLMLPLAFLFHRHLRRKFHDLSR